MTKHWSLNHSSRSAQTPSGIAAFRTLIFPCILCRPTVVFGLINHFSNMAGYEVPYRLAVFMGNSSRFFHCNAWLPQASGFNLDPFDHFLGSCLQFLSRGVLIMGSKTGPPIQALHNLNICPVGHHRQPSKQGMPENRWPKTLWNMTFFHHPIWFAKNQQEFSSWKLQYHWRPCPRNSHQVYPRKNQHQMISFIIFLAFPSISPFPSVDS